MSSSSATTFSTRKSSISKRTRSKSCTISGYSSGNKKLYVTDVDTGKAARLRRLGFFLTKLFFPPQIPTQSR